MLWLLATAPLWLGPLAALGAEAGLERASVIVAASPLVHLGVAAGQDLLRTQWWYAHTSFGSLQFDYPSLDRHRPSLRGHSAGARCTQFRHQGVHPMKKLALLALAATLAIAPAAQAADQMDPALKEKARRSIDAGLHYLRGQQAENGSLSGSVGITALALRGFLESHRGYNEGDGPFVTRPVEFLLSKVNDDGSISESLQNRSYNTAVSLVALAATKNPKYQAAIANGQKFLTGHQIDESEGYKQDHRYYGGVGYGGDERPDLSNLYLAIEGLKASATDPKDPVWQKALVFVNRSQNRSESNDQPWAGNDGGFVYMPGWNPPEFGGKNRHPTAA